MTFPTSHCSSPPVQLSWWRWIPEKTDDFRGRGTAAHVHYERFVSRMNLVTDWLPGHVLGFQLQINSFPGERTLFAQTCRTPSVRPCTQGQNSPAVDGTVTSHNRPGPASHTGTVRARTKTERRINTKYWSKNRFRKTGACEAVSNTHGDNAPSGWRSPRL